MELPSWLIGRPSSDADSLAGGTTSILVMPPVRDGTSVVEGGRRRRVFPGLNMRFTPGLSGEERAASAKVVWGCTVRDGRRMDDGAGRGALGAPEGSVAPADASALGPPKGWRGGPDLLWEGAGARLAGCL